MKKGFIRKLLFILLPLIALVVIALLDPDAAKLGSVLRQINILWLFCALGAMLLYFLFDNLTYLMVCNIMQFPQRFFDGLLTTMYGFFYHAVTPFASGGQPMQVLQMHKRGINVGLATPALIMKFLAYQIAVTTVCIIAYAYFGMKHLGERPAILVLSLIGFVIYLSSIVLVALILFKTSWVFNIGNRLIKFIGRLFFKNNPSMVAKAMESFKKVIADYSHAVSIAQKYKSEMGLIVLTSLIQAFAYFSIPYFIYRGLGLSEYGIMYITLLQGLLYVAVSFFPLPGASVASEGGFYLMFEGLFPSATLFAAALIWRFITFYIEIILGYVAVLIDGLSAANTKHANGVDDNVYDASADDDNSN